MKKIAIAADHGGFEMKESLKDYVSSKGFQVIDLGTNSLESVNYPTYGKACAMAVAEGRADLGIVICGSGIGISIAANRVKGIRCALCTSAEMGRLAAMHNNANMIALGGRLTTLEEAEKIIDAWLDTTFEGGRHINRINMLDDDSLGC